MKKRVNIYISTVVHEAATNFCTSAGKTFSAFVERLLETAVEKENKDVRDRTDKRKRWETTKGKA